jgi:hypothetical protein
MHIQTIGGDGRSLGKAARKVGASTSPPGFSLSSPGLSKRPAPPPLQRGASRLMLACTEVPIGLNQIASELLALSIDTTRSLADACVAYWQQSKLEALPD